MPIPIVGEITVSIKLDALSHIQTNVKLYVLDNELWKTDVILGRDFIDENQITVIVKPRGKK